SSSAPRRAPHGRSAPWPSGVGAPRGAMLVVRGTMRASTANRAALWIVAAVGLVALIAIVSGDPDGRELVAGALFVAFVIGGGMWLTYRYRVSPRRMSFVDQVGRADLRAEPGDPLDLL